MEQKILVIVGPTAVGKTALSIRLAKDFQGEIISCDSMQSLSRDGYWYRKGDEEGTNGGPSSFDRYCST